MEFVEDFEFFGLIIASHSDSFNHYNHHITSHQCPMLICWFNVDFIYAWPYFVAMNVRSNGHFTPVTPQGARGVYHEDGSI